MTLVSVERPNTGNKSHNDQQMIRTALIAELDAISLYQAQIDSLDSDDAKLVINHIMNEEKEHASELWCLIMKLDEKQEEKMTEVNISTCIAGDIQS